MSKKTAKKGKAKTRAGRKPNLTLVPSGKKGEVQCIPNRRAVPEGKAAENPPLTKGELRAIADAMVAIDADNIMEHIIDGAVAFHEERGGDLEASFDAFFADPEGLHAILPDSPEDEKQKARIFRLLDAFKARHRNLYAAMSPPDFDAVFAMFTERVGDTDYFSMTLELAKDRMRADMEATG